MNKRKLNEHLEDELFNREKREIKPKIINKSIEVESMVKTVKKKRPYYRKKNNKPKPVEIVTNQTKTKNIFLKGLCVGFVIGVILSYLICY
jgi:hypothetical protein